MTDSKQVRETINTETKTAAPKGLLSSIFGSPFAVLKPKTFIDYMKIRETEIARVLAEIINGLPAATNTYDNRFFKSETFCRVLEDEFSHINYDGRYGTVGYDLTYNRSSKVSLKFQGTIFQRQDRRTKDYKLTKPRSVVLRNKLGGQDHVPTKESYFDYLLAVEGERDEKTGVVWVRFGVSPYEVVSENITYNGGKNDQVKCKIYNSDWEFLSEKHEFPTEVTDIRFNERTSDLFHTGFDNIARGLRRLGADNIVD